MARPPALERRVLDLLWSRDECSVREVHEGVDRALAYTTIATVLDRLHRKGEVLRTKDGAAWRYRAARSRQASLAEQVSALVGRAHEASEPLLVAFLDQVQAVDPDALDRLEALIAARRERQ